MLKVGGLGPFVPRLEWAMLSAALSFNQRSQLLTHTVFAHFANLQKSPNLNGKYLFFFKVRQYRAKFPQKKFFATL
jgi:hypothetical protein